VTNIAFEFEIKNARSKQMSMRIEPWGDVSQVEPGKSLRLRVDGPISDDPSHSLVVQVEDDNHVSVWGWSGSGITIL
jgi:hypothetical protein